VGNTSLYGRADHESRDTSCRRHRTRGVYVAASGADERGGVFVSCRSRKMGVGARRRAVDRALSMTRTRQTDLGEGGTWPPYTDR